MKDGKRKKDRSIFEIYSNATVGKLLIKRS